MTPLLTLGIALLIAVVLWRIWTAPIAITFRALDRRHGRLRSCRVTTGPIDWHVLEGGRGETLVLLHGFNADADHFNRVARHLSRHFRILAPDLPGFGETRVDGPPDYRISAQAERVLAWMDAVGIQHCYLGGSSMGGYIATEIARRAPGRVRALWLLAPGGVLEVPHSPLFQEIAEERHNPLVIRDLDDFRRLIDYCFVHPPWIPGPLMRHLARRATDRTLEHQRAFDAIRYDSEPLESIADGLATPALVVWGRSDQVLNPAGAAVLERVMPNAEVLLLPDTGHLPMLENPCTVAESWISYTEKRARDRLEP
ncbi:alpha/beta fold hydrolase [Wenzhouxiangella sp. XN79A]|uniref:alpha/beta fold hydrolase n=1 Tax=Wenzhouxiangella sp. XN79A TaxID=2724193 RepID=UPI00144AF7EB|nr:alpha/beta fold hydrolase [Wenzhouxiangella sp. XN79A]NKI35893.1 alpha/beta fold hydrolase [Wenzhouxiangella sp. XN79A]